MPMKVLTKIAVQGCVWLWTETDFSEGSVQGEPLIEDPQSVTAE